MGLHLLVASNLYMDLHCFVQPDFLHHQHVPSFSLPTVCQVGALHTELVVAPRPSTFVCFHRIRQII